MKHYISGQQRKNAVVEPGENCEAVNCGRTCSGRPAAQVLYVAWTPADLMTINTRCAHNAEVFRDSLQASGSA